MPGHRGHQRYESAVYGASLIAQRELYRAVRLVDPAGHERDFVLPPILDVIARDGNDSPEGAARWLGNIYTVGVGA